MTRKHSIQSSYVRLIAACGCEMRSNVTRSVIAHCSEHSKTKAAELSEVLTNVLHWIKTVKDGYGEWMGGKKGNFEVETDIEKLLDKVNEPAEVDVADLDKELSQAPSSSKPKKQKLEKLEKPNKPFNPDDLPPSPEGAMDPPDKEFVEALRKKYREKMVAYGEQMEAYKAQQSQPLSPNGGAEISSALYATEEVSSEQSS